MIKKLAAVLAAVMLITCIFAACGKESNPEGSNSFVGTWKGVDEGFDVVYAFEADGTGYSEALGMTIDLTYEIDGNKITITTDATSVMEDMMGMTVEEMLAEGMLEDTSTLITVQTGELNGDVLTIDGTEYTKAAE